ncbi:hypothetical protein [Photobacterium halotolerans]|uniref:Uncharacterized protein n=1 Tax=Photobacterium halotolerans TaxID=265726 RepID=A0A7X5AS76_9GAMM|nr:hypothetical protein [Photobacterium halotolerans]NAW64517.1 hypothetical protein [Photobacterium halotolerans]
MSFNQFMPARAQRHYQISGNFLHVEKAPGPVLIMTEAGRYVLYPGAGVQSDTLNGNVQVENMSDADGQVTLVSGFGRYFPPTDGQEVKVTQMPDVKLASGQAVVVSELPAVTFAPGQQVGVAQLPAVALAADQQVNVGQLPAVTLAPEQTVITQPVRPTSVAASVLTIATGAAELPANPARVRVTVRASAANTQDILIEGGFAIAPGEREELFVTGAVSFAGLDGETLDVLETLQ